MSCLQGEDEKNGKRKDGVQTYVFLNVLSNRRFVLQNKKKGEILQRLISKTTKVILPLSDNHIKSFKNKAGENKASLPPVWSDMVPCMIPISLVGPWETSLFPH